MNTPKGRKWGHGATPGDGLGGVCKGLLKSKAAIFMKEPFSPCDLEDKVKEIAEKYNDGMKV